MVLTESNMLALGSIAPDFELKDVVTGRKRSLQKLRSKKGTLIMFICNHCPYVKHVQLGILVMAREYIAKGISVVAISSNDIEKYPDDSPKEMKRIAKHFSYPFPYLYDETQEVAKAYKAACTPDFFLFDGDLKLVYRGQMDGSRPGNRIPVSGKDLRNAMKALLNGDPISEKQTPSMGCNIKWKE
ncbi:thioredoxin family protein [Puteibacter caeruleilacunae]|nr:thioredoxin family protein [Puteibacter caeruleilacunae]